MNLISKDHVYDDNSDSFVGKYHFSDLWEIHASFRHYRCENFANHVRTSSSSSCLESNERHKALIENDLHSSTQSAPPSPKCELKTLEDTVSNLVVKPRRLYQKNQSNSTSSLGGFIKKITRLRRPSSKPWMVINMTQDINGKKKEHFTPLSQFQSCDQSFNSCAQRSRSETKIQTVYSTQRKSLQDLKSILELGDKKANIEKPNPNQTQRDLTPFKALKSSLSSYKESTECSDTLSPRRLTNPPQSLNLRDKIVVKHSQQFKRSYSNMTSIDSIGNCSLDVNSDKSTLPPTHTPRSISDHTLKSVSLLEENINKLNGKSPSLHMLKNGHRIPSYVGISCAISGYSNYNRYCRQNSPTLRNLNQEPVNHLNELRKNSLITETLITSRHNNQIQTNGTEHFLELKHNSIKPNSKTNDLNSNSLLQQRIASLYGETFAADWRESRIKNKYKKNNSSIIDKVRSPSCPPTPPNDSDIDTTHKSPQVFDHTLIPTEIAQPLEAANQESANIENSQMKPIADHEAVPSQTTSFIGDTFAQSKASTEKDGNWFLSELNKTTIEIQKKIDLTEKMLEEEHNSMNDDISGKLRAAIGKANLLITKKFNQFRQLCIKNISQSDCEQFKTTNDDLEGFWDMVSIQVTDVNETFNEINDLCARGWKIDVPKKITFSPAKPRSRKSTPKGSPEKSCDESSNDRDIERRNRLKEAKRKAKLKAAKNEDEITIFIPSNSKE